MPIIEKLTIPPLYTHSIDYDNNLTIYEAYGAMLHTLNKTIDSLNNVTQNIIPALTNRVSINENNITLLLEYVDTLQQQMSTLLNTTIPTINDTLTAHNTRITTNETEIAKIKNDIISINNNLNTINSSLLDINLKISTLENNYESLENIVTQHTTEISSINSSIEDIETTLADFNTKITNNENAISTINTEMQEINQKIDNLNINEINALLQQIQTDINTANNIIKQFSEISNSTLLIDNNITSKSGVKITKNIIEKNGNLCNLILAIENLGDLITINHPTVIGDFQEEYLPISIDTTGHTYLGNCIIYLVYQESSSAPKISYFPATLWAYISGGKVKLQIRVSYPDNFTIQNSSIFINLPYFKK